MVSSDADSQSLFSHQDRLLIRFNSQSSVVSLAMLVRISGGKSRGSFGSFSTYVWRTRSGVNNLRLRLCRGIPIPCDIWGWVISDHAPQPKFPSPVWIAILNKPGKQKTLKEEIQHSKKYTSLSCFIMWPRWSPHSSGERLYGVTTKKLNMFTGWWSIAATSNLWWPSMMKWLATASLLYLLK